MGIAITRATEFAQVSFVFLLSQELFDFRNIFPLPIAFTSANVREELEPRF